MKTLHENMHSDMGEVFRLVGVCLDAMGRDDVKDAKGRDLIRSLLVDVAKYGTADGSLSSVPSDTANSSLDELRQASSAIRESALQYISSLTDEQILDNPTGDVEGSIYFKLSHAHFASAWRIGQLHLVLGIDG
jgi:hypothetical protein